MSKKGYGTTFAPGILLLMKAAATSAFGFPTSSRLWVIHHYGISEPEEKLTIEVGIVNCVHIDYVNVAKPNESQIFQKFTSQSSSSDN